MDEVSFLGPELGALAALLVGPEAGGWTLDEANVSSARTHHMDRCARVGCLQASRVLGPSRGAGRAAHSTAGSFN